MEERETKIMLASDFTTRRKMIDYINKMKVPREDIVSIYHTDEGYSIIYYYGGEHKGES